MSDLIHEHKLRFSLHPQWCEEMNKGSGQMRCGWYVHVPQINSSPRLLPMQITPQVMRLCNATENSGWKDRRYAAHDCTTVEIMQVSLIKDQVVETLC